VDTLAADMGTLVQVETKASEGGYACNWSRFYACHAESSLDLASARLKLLVLHIPKDNYSASLSTKEDLEHLASTEQVRR